MSRIGGQVVGSLLSAVFACFGALMVGRFTWVVLVAVSAPRDGPFLSTVFAGAASLLFALAVCGGAIGGLAMAGAVWARTSEAYSATLVLFLAGSSFAVSSSLLPAAEYLFRPRSIVWWWQIRGAGFLEGLAWFVSSVAFARFAVAFARELDWTVTGRVLGRLATAVESKGVWGVLLLLLVTPFDDSSAIEGVLWDWSWSIVISVTVLVALQLVGVAVLAAAVKQARGFARVRGQLVSVAWIAFFVGVAGEGVMTLLYDFRRADLFLGLAYLVHLGLLSVGVIFYATLGSGLVVQRSLIVAVVAVSGAFVFSGLEGVISDYVVGQLGLPDVVSSFLAGGLVAAVLAGRKARRRGGEARDGSN